MRIDIKSYDKELMRAAFQQLDETIHIVVIGRIEVPFMLSPQPIKDGVAGWVKHDRVYMWAVSKQFHRGEHRGTLAHETYHWATARLADASYGEWKWGGVWHPEQEALYDKWKDHCSGFYASTKPEEMGAECFRVLQGCYSGETWEQNQALLEDWKRFFLNDGGLAPFFS